MPGTKATNLRLLLGKIGAVKFATIAQNVCPLHKEK
jgi:hypothetical protein